MHYLPVKKLSALVRGTTSKHGGDFYCLNCLHSFRTKNKLESYRNVCENEEFCGVVMPSEDTRHESLINTENLRRHCLLFMHILNI